MAVKTQHCTRRWRAARCGAPLCRKGVARAVLVRPLHHVDAGSNWGGRRGRGGRGPQGDGQHGPVRGRRSAAWELAHVGP